MKSDPLLREAHVPEIATPAAGVGRGRAESVFPGAMAEGPVESVEDRQGLPLRAGRRRWRSRALLSTPRISIVGQRHLHGPI